MVQGLILTLKSNEDSGVNVVGVAAVDILVTLDQVDSFLLFSDTTLKWIIGIAPVDIVVVEGLDGPAILGLFFGISLQYFDS